MMENGRTQYQLTLNDTTFTIHELQPDGSLEYVGGSARPAPENGTEYTQTEKDSYIALVMMSLGMALAEAPPDTVITVEGKSPEMANIGRMLQTMVGQLVAA